MSNAKPYSAGSSKDAWWADPRVSDYLFMCSRMSLGLPACPGIYGLYQGGGPKAVHYGVAAGGLERRGPRTDPPRRSST